MPINFTEKRQVRFENKSVGDRHPCFITFEAGPTHEGLESAKYLVSLAAEAGADAVKFQIFDPDRLIADKKQLFSYEVLKDRETLQTETVKEPLYDIMVRRAMTNAEWKELKRHSDSLNLAFFATIGFKEELILLEELNCDSVKIASGDVNHWPLIRMAAETGMCLQLDTGNASIGEIEEAVDLIREVGNERIIIHQCPSGYPARLPSINLNIVETLRQMFLYPVAYSDHNPGADIDIAALAMGANLVEKTITLDRTTRSVEHIFSLEPNEMNDFVQRIRNLEIAMGSHRRVMQPIEIDQRQMIRRSVFLTKDAPKGTNIKDLKIDFRRPGDGISPKEWELLSGVTLKRGVKAGEKLLNNDLTT